MNKIRSPKIFFLIICLALLLTNGCVELPKDRPSISLKNPVAHYKVKPKVQLETTFNYSNYHRWRWGDEYRNEDDTLRRIVEKVIKENELFDSYSAEPISTDYKIVFWLTKNKKDTGFAEQLKEEGNYGAYIGSFTLFPLAEKRIYYLSISVYKSEKHIYGYSCTNESTDVHGPLFTSPNNPPLKMIEKMVKEALFNVIDNSGIRESYKLEP